MKKTILSLTLLLATSVGFSAMAQTQTDCKKDCKTPDAKCMKACDQKDAPRPCPFDGLNLTEQQKTQLQALAPEKPSKENREKMMAEKKAEKQAKAENRAQARKEYLAKVKAILTPEQYTQFLENSFVNQMNKQGARHGEKGKFGKDGKKNFQKKGDRKGQPAKSDKK